MTTINLTPPHTSEPGQLYTPPAPKRDHAAPLDRFGATLRAAVAGIYRGAVVRVAHRNPAGLTVPLAGELGVVEAIAFDGTPTIQLHRGDIFNADAALYVVTPVTELVAPDFLTTGKWTVRRVQLADGRHRWEAAPEAAGRELTHAEKVARGARWFTAAHRARGYAIGKAQENLA